MLNGITALFIRYFDASAIVAFKSDILAYVPLAEEIENLPLEPWHDLHLLLSIGITSAVNILLGATVGVGSLVCGAFL